MQQDTAFAGPELVTFGESMGLFTAQDTRGLEYASTLHKSFGGAESNVAIGVARLGLGGQAGSGRWAAIRSGR